jgi:hypothetical protein
MAKVPRVTGRRARSASGGAPPISEQSRKFIEAARELGCDEDEEAFKRVVRTVAAHKQSAKPPPASEIGRGQKKGEKGDGG